MQPDYPEPFIQGTIEMMATMLGVECEPVEGADQLPIFISGVINLTGNSDGQVAMSFPTETARQLVAEMLAVDVSEMDEDTLRDGVGEMCNIVAGHAKAKLADTKYHFMLTIPSIVIGADHQLDMFRARKVFSQRMSTSLGDFTVTVWLVPVEE